MNISYMYANGNIHIFDEKHNKRVIEYKDGFEEMLILENKFDLCEKFIVQNEECIWALRCDLDKQFVVDLTMIVAYFFTGHALPMAIDYFCKLDLASMDINVKNLSVLTGIIGLCIGVTKSIINHKSKKEDFLDLHARTVSRYKFHLLYDKYKSLYDELSNSNKKENESKYKEKQFEIIDLNYDNTFKEVQNYFVTRVVLEAYKNELIRDYKKGVLRKCLKNIDPVDLDVIENMVKEELDKYEKGKQYVKTK